MKRYQASKHILITLMTFILSLAMWAAYFIGDARLKLARPLRVSELSDLKQGTYVRFDISSVIIGKYGSVCASSSNGAKTFEYFTIPFDENTWIRVGISDPKTISQMERFTKGINQTLHLTGRVNRKLEFGTAWYEKGLADFDPGKVVRDLVIDQTTAGDLYFFRIMAVVFLITSLILFVTIGGIKVVYVRPFTDSQKYKECYFGKGFDLEKRLVKEQENLKIYEKEQKESWKSCLVGAALLFCGLLVIAVSILMSMATIIYMLTIGVVIGAYLIFMSPYWFWSGFVNSGSTLARKISDLFLLRTTSVKIDECYKMIQALKKHVDKNEAEQEQVKMWYGPGVWEEEEGDSGNESDAAK
ncbi:MAG: hypothetical protein IK081_06670 [Lachnospiraceae bacterium]|nr:hypothetical protein [Lachnospiraceae bacterium]